jgi:hypothetical protein
MDRLYVVALEGWPELPLPSRIEAEVKFVTELERLLGGPSGVLKALAEDEKALEPRPDPDDHRREHTALARAIPRAEAMVWRAWPQHAASAAFRVHLDGE